LSISSSFEVAEVEAVERLVRHQHGVRHEQADRQQGTLALSLRQAADCLVEERVNVETADDLVAQIGAAVEEPEGVVDRPADRLRRPRGDCVG
jgi:hypothetical protein